MKICKNCTNPFMFSNDKVCEWCKINDPDGLIANFISNPYLQKIAQESKREDGYNKVRKTVGGFYLPSMREDESFSDYEKRNVHYLKAMAALCSGGGHFGTSYSFLGDKTNFKVVFTHYID